MIHRLIYFVKKQYVFSLISKLLMVLIGFGYTVCLARYLGPSLKGEIAYISSMISITTILFGGGIHQFYPYLKKETGKDVSPFFVKLSALMLCLYSLIAITLTMSLHIKFETIIIILLTPISVYSKIIAYIYMIESPNKKSIIELFANLFELVVVIVLWFSFPVGWWGGIVLLSIKNILFGFIYSYKFRATFLKKKQLTYVECLSAFKFGFFPMLILLMNTMNYRIDVIMLNHSVPSVEVGVYSVGVALAERVWIIPDALKEVMISKLTKGRDIDEVSFVIRVCNTACIIIVARIIVGGQLFINFFFGEEYSSSYLVTIILLIGVIFMVYYKIVGAYDIVSGNQKENFVYLFISLVSNILANLLFIPLYGILGAALASVFSYAIAAYLLTYKFMKRNNVKISEMLILNKNDIFILRTHFLSPKNINEKESTDID